MKLVTYKYLFLLFSNVFFIIFITLIPFVFSLLFLKLIYYYYKINLIVTSST